MTKEGAAMKKEKETSPEQHLRDLVAGRRSDIPEEGLPGIPILYQSGPVRVHDSRTKGPVFITAEREVLVDVELVAGSGGIAIERVRYGYGPRTWRFPSPTDPPPKKKTPWRDPGRKSAPGETPRTLGKLSDIHQQYAET